MGRVLRTMSIRLYPSRAQTERLDHLLFVGRVTFNRALESRIYWYKASGKTLSYYDQCSDLTELRRADCFWSDIPLEIQRDALRRVDKAYKAFFRRVKTGKPGGFPRFKSQNRWNTFTNNGCGNPVKGDRIRVSSVVGFIRCRNLRPISGKIIEQRIVRRAGKWFCQLVIDGLTVPTDPVPIQSAIGIDVGLTSFATLSSGESIQNPRFGRTLARKLSRAHRRVSRTKKGSRNRRKVVIRLQQVYLTIANARLNFTHHVSKEIIKRHQLIAVENLNIAGMIRGRLAKSILDACWAQFIWQLAYKAESAGCTFVRVDPNGTTQECSQCGKTVQKELSNRIHSCECGCVLDRDHNAAINVLRRGIQSSLHPAAVGGSVMPAEGPRVAPKKQEAPKSTTPRGV